LFIDGLISRIVYIASLRLGGRKLPTYELMLHLLGVATMYGNVYIASLRLGGRKLPTYELMLRLLGVATMYGWISRYRNGNVV
jgi:uncharacterized membrane protein